MLNLKLPEKQEQAKHKTPMRNKKNKGRSQQNRDQKSHTKNQ
jgi:hypothetical protein